jgi:hypothetical protein
MSLARAARAQLVRAEKLGVSLDVRMKEKQEGHDGWIPDEDWRRDFGAVTTTLQHAGNSLVRALEGNKKDLGGQTEQQLDAQFQAELVQAAPALTDEQWEKMAAARAKMKKG